MVKTPKTRHSKSRREPVTIELEPGAVSRITDEDAAKAAYASTLEKTGCEKTSKAAYDKAMQASADLEIADDKTAS